MDNKLNKNCVDWIPLILIIYNFIANLANDIYLPSMPKMTEIFSTNSKMLQLSMTAWFIGIAIPQFIIGPLSDKIGRRPILIISSICFLFATFACIYSPNIYALIIARLFQGIGVCGLNVTTFSILVDLYDHKKRVYILNYLTMLASLAPLLGPIIGGYIFIWYGWRANFIFIFLFILIFTLLVWLKVHESKQELDKNSIHIPILYKNYLKLILSKQYLKSLAPYCLLLSGLIVYLTAAPFIIINNLHVAPQLFGYTQIPIVVASMVGSTLVHIALKNFDTKILITVGIIIILISSLLMLISGFYFYNSLLAFLMPMVLYTFGFSLCSSPLITNTISHNTSLCSHSAALLGFSMASCCSLANGFLSVIYDGRMITVAILLLFISLAASSFYFFYKNL